VSDFLRALHDALDERRRARRLTWAAATREINRGVVTRHQIARSTIAGLKTKSVAEGDGVLQMLLWLGRTPESVVPGFADAGAERFQLPMPAEHEVLRWDLPKLYTALDAERQARGKSWAVVAREIGGVTPGVLTGLARASRVGFPGVMRIIAWLGRPAAAFTRIAAR